MVYGIVWYDMVCYDMVNHQLNNTEHRNTIENSFFSPCSLDFRYMTASCHIPFISNAIVALTRGPPAGYSGGDTVIWAVRICVDWAFISLLAVTGLWSTIL